MIIETAVITAIITGLCGVIGQYMMLQKSKREEDAKQQVKDALMEARLDRLEEKLDAAIDRIDEHNGLADRFKDACNSFNVIIAELRTELKMIKESR